MSKIGLIIKREYTTRVRSKSFLLGTLLAPVGLLAYFLVIFGLSRYSGGDQLRVAVLDEGKMIGQIPDDKSVKYIMNPGASLDALKEKVVSGEYDGVLRVPTLANFKNKDFTVYYYSDDRLAMEKIEMLENKIESKVRDFKIDSLHLDRKALESLETNISIEPETVTGKNEDDTKYTAGIGLGIGFIMTFIMFFMVFFYGQMVMRSVMEEKTNRIVEVMMSTVKPFELMMGKIIGTGLVGLTQVLAWTVLNSIVFMLLPMILHIDPNELNNTGAMAGAASQVDPDMVQSEVSHIFSEVMKQNWPLMIFSFIVYFLGGYFIYASMFAAIGSAIGDDMAEGQSLTLPVSLPIVLAFYITLIVGMRNPNSGLMVFTSIFPLFSPIGMPFRLAFNPPWWQIGLSMVLLVAAAFFFVWLAARIYRVGILLYGKKVTFKELGKWLFYKS